MGSRFRIRLSPRPSPDSFPPPFPAVLARWRDPAPRSGEHPPQRSPAVPALYGRKDFRAANPLTQFFEPPLRPSSVIFSLLLSSVLLPSERPFFGFCLLRFPSGSESDTLSPDPFTGGAGCRVSAFGGRAHSLIVALCDQTMSAQPDRGVVRDQTMSQPISGGLAAQPMRCAAQKLSRG
jgi:hypothetical protein